MASNGETENYLSPLDSIDLINPLELLAEWVDEAKELGLPEPDAMNLATVDKNGNPHNRMVLMRHINDTEIGFFTNLASSKANDIFSSSKTSSTLWWPQLGRQVRIEGTAKEMNRNMVDSYFAQRPRNSKIAAWSSKQSSELESMDKLHEVFDGFKDKFAAETILTPPFWGGFTITVEKIEYWLGREFRLHDRIVLSKLGDTWTKIRIYP
ncbi:MAG: pyridoxamine 5'-phosphate oxidase [Euryarchaeota archaeon]|nr:pyridoxamine 5'-phosphate oxidase [Euryarchaeota archaeon]